MRFDSPAELEHQVRWRSACVDSSPVAEVMSWVVGRSAPPDWVVEEVSEQLADLLAAVRSATRAELRPCSTLRRWTDQAGIWRRKYAFDVPGAFGRITDDARARYPELHARGDAAWNPASAVHRRVWHGMSAAQRQVEILSTSSAPGISRHHWGTDVDLGSVSPADWATPGGRHAAEYGWLTAQAAGYGFVQCYTARTAALGGYREERWHWSYHPVSAALTDWALRHDPELDHTLRVLWRDGAAGPAAEFSWIADNWRRYVFTVDVPGRGVNLPQRTP
jgi:hypothetical protein